MAGASKGRVFCCLGAAKLEKVIVTGACSGFHRFDLVRPRSTFACGHPAMGVLVRSCAVCLGPAEGAGSHGFAFCWLAVSGVGCGLAVVGLQHLRRHQSALSLLAIRDVILY